MPTYPIFQSTVTYCFRLSSGLCNQVPVNQSFYCLNKSISTPRYFLLCIYLLSLPSHSISISRLRKTASPNHLSRPLRMRTLRKRHSWPPLRKPRAFFLDESIDENPFAYFISPAEDRDVFTNSHLAADIDDRRRSRSLSPAHRGGLSALAATAAASSPTAKLKKWIERMELRCLRRSPSASEIPMPSPNPPKPLQAYQTVSPPVRGRRDIRSSSRRRVNRNTRSHSRRPRVWREPSKDIWPVSEEGEEIGLGISI